MTSEHCSIPRSCYTMACSNVGTYDSRYEHPIVLLVSNHINWGLVVVVIVGGGGKGLLLGSHCDGRGGGQEPPKQPLFRGGCLKHGDMWTI